MARGSNRVKEGFKNRDFIEREIFKLKQIVINSVFFKTGVKLPETQTLDQLLRSAARINITFNVTLKELNK